MALATVQASLRLYCSDALLLMSPVPRLPVVPPVPTLTVPALSVVVPV